MKKYLICNYGCDDGNEFEMELTEEQANFLVKVFEENNKKADYQCKPDLYICDNYTKKDGWYSDLSYMNKSYVELKKENNIWKNINLTESEKDRKRRLRIR